MEILLEKVELGRSVKTISIGCCAVLSHVGLCNPIDGSLLLSPWEFSRQEY